jgi:hypothetical protein
MTPTVTDFVRQVTKDGNRSEAAKRTKTSVTKAKLSAPVRAVRFECPQAMRRALELAAEAELITISTLMRRAAKRELERLGYDWRAASTQPVAAPPKPVTP